ncbi:MAG: GAF domain-containing protein [Chloroflexi bacterium]|nr:GAF domain-containing protein [Chloroflexota bacterium]
MFTPKATRPQAMTALRQIAQALSTVWDLNSALDLIVRKTTEVMQVDSCTLYLVDAESMTLRLRATTGLAKRALGRATLEMGQGMTGFAAQSNRPIFARNARQNPHFKWVDEAEETQFASLLAVPLLIEKDVIGALNVQTQTPHDFISSEVELLSLIGDIAAGTLVKAQLYDKHTHQIEEMRLLAIENARLVTNTAVIREMHHRIKNNLQTVAMLMQLQMADADQLNPREVLKTNIHRIRSIAAVHEILSEKGFRLVDVKDVLLRISHTTAETMTHPNQSIHIRVFGDAITLPSKPATAIALVVNELVQNSLDHAFVDWSGEGKIDVSLGHSPEEIIIIVRDNGRGLPTEIISGLGLEIVETLVKEDLQGQIKFHRPNIGGTEVSLRLPRAIEQELSL